MIENSEKKILPNTEHHNHSPLATSKSQNSIIKLPKLGRNNHTLDLSILPATIQLEVAKETERIMKLTAIPKIDDSPHTKQKLPIDFKIQHAKLIKSSLSAENIFKYSNSLTIKQEKIEQLKAKTQEETRKKQMKKNEISKMREVKRKVHNLIKSDPYFICKNFQAKNDSFNEKILEHMESTYYKKALFNYHSNLHLRFHKNPMGAAHNPLDMVLDVEKMKKEMRSPEKTLKEALQKEELETIVLDPGYYVRDVNYMREVNLFHQKMLIERLGEESDEKKLEALNEIKKSGESVNNALSQRNFEGKHTTTFFKKVHSLQKSIEKELNRDLSNAGSSKKKSPKFDSSLVPSYFRNSLDNASSQLHLSAAKSLRRPFEMKIKNQNPKHMTTNPMTEVNAPHVYQRAPKNRNTHSTVEMEYRQISRYLTQIKGNSLVRRNPSHGRNSTRNPEYP